MGCLGRRSTHKVGARLVTSIFFRSWRNSDLPENTQKFRLWGQIGM
jgi:hypothetical protein